MSASIERATLIERIAVHTIRGRETASCELVTLLDPGRYPRMGVPLYELTDVYTLPRDRRSGWGRAVVEKAVRFAEARGWDLYLRVVAYETSKTTKTGRLSTKQLIAFYATFGFKPRKGDDRIMIRRCRARRSRD